MTSPVKTFGRSDVGLIRRNNEDAFTINPERGFAAVADGMGGAAAGEVASRILIETAGEVLSRNVSSVNESLDSVRKAFTVANQRILDLVRQKPEYAGMGCTAEVLLYLSRSLVIGHVGDSRTYLFRKGELTQITKDHSLVQKQFDEGIISVDEKRTHPLRNIITKAVGISEELEADIVTMEPISGDCFLLCSDGLTDMLEDSSILEVLAGRAGIDAKADELVSRALSAGGRDNVTVVLFEVR